MSATFISRSTFNLPSKGVWLIVCGYEWEKNVATAQDITFKRIILSTSDGGTNPIAYGLSYYEDINDSELRTGTRQIGTIMGVVSVNNFTTVYANASSFVNTGTNTKLVLNISWTKIG
jgi:hypothetical protein